MTYEQNQLKEEVLTHLEDYLVQRGTIPYQGFKSNFRCVNPAHEDVHPSMGIMKDKNKVHCLSCNATYDVLDLIGLDYSISDYPGQIKKACDLFNIRDAASNEKKQKNEAPEEDKEKDYTDFFNIAHNNIDKCPNVRGLSAKTLNRFNIGYVEYWKHPNAKSSSVPTSPRLIIPTSKTSYTARDTRPDSELSDTEKAYKKMKTGKAHIFNIDALTTAASPIFLVEGEIDAMSIIDAGSEAIGLGSINAVDRFLTELDIHKTEQPLIISLDNEANENVKRAESTLLKGIEKLGLKCIIYNQFGKYKDANEFYVKDKAQFKEALKDAEEKANKKNEEELEAYRDTFNNGFLESFSKHRRESNKQKPIYTGLSELDRILGSIYPELYIIGAIPSLGKTSFLLQIADNVAKLDNDVLYFSLEMGREELMARSISRQTYIRSQFMGHNTKYAKTTRALLNNCYDGAITDEAEAIIGLAEKDYLEYAKNIRVIEGIGDFGVTKIRDEVQRHISLTGKKPVVFIDYLQILAPYDVRCSDKQNTDTAIKELKRISRDFNIPVLAISSFNRNNYTDPVNLSAFKESGAIEYGSDKVIGLQYLGMDYTESEKESDRNKKISKLLEKMETIAKKPEGVQKVQVKMLKARNDAKDSCVLRFKPMFNYFE